MLFSGDFNERRFGNFVIRPTSIVLLRQAIEIRLRSAVKVNMIKEASGSPAKIPQKVFFWLFKAHPKDVILPLEISLIEKIFDWTQPYIHGGLLQWSWEIEWAHHLLEPLFASAKVGSGFHYLGNIKVRKSFVDDLEKEINKLLGRQPRPSTKLGRFCAKFHKLTDPPVKIEWLSSADAEVIP